MAFSSQTQFGGRAEMGQNSKFVEHGQVTFSTTDATGNLKLANIRTLEGIWFTPHAAPAADEQVYCGELGSAFPVAVGSDGYVVITRTGASKTSGLKLGYLAIGT